MSANNQLMDLISSASIGAYSAVESVLENNLCDVNAVNEKYWTALMYAANFGHFNIIKLLVKYNCSVDLQDSKGRTALMLAACNGHTRSIDALITCGQADKTVKDFKGADAMTYAKNNGHGNNKLIKNLLANGSDGHQLKGRYMSSTDRELRLASARNRAPIPSLAPARNRAPIPPLAPAPNQAPIPSMQITPTEEPQYIYNPYETTAFSSDSLSHVWRPTRGDICGQTDAFGLSIHELTPPESSGESALSSSQSSQSSTHSSVISAPKSFKRKAPTAQNKCSAVPITAPMPNTLFHLLTRIELIEYLDVFESNSIDFIQFLTLTDQDFQNLGITSYGHRKKLSIAQKRYHESLNINCTAESFLADYLLNEREVLNKKIKALEEKVMLLENTSQRQNYYD